MQQLLEDRLRSLENSLEALQLKLQVKEREIQDLQDIENIKILQNCYGYYIEHWMSQELIDLFADHAEVSATFTEGTYLGLEGVRRYFGRMKSASPEFLHTVMQISPVITLSEERQRAKGRFYGYGTICLKTYNNGPDPIYMSVTYEMEYIRQNGVWKILKLGFQNNYSYKIPRPDAPDNGIKGSVRNLSTLSPDVWAENVAFYPAGYIYPFHFKHPVTGKETQEKEYNASVVLKPSTFKQAAASNT